MKCIRSSYLLALTLMSIQTGLGQTPSGNKAVSRSYFEEVVNKQKLELLKNVFADSFLVHVLLDSTEARKSVADQATFLKYFFKAFPDVHYSIGDIMEDGDRVAMRVMFSGTHRGEFWGYAPSGNHIKYLSEIFFFRFQNGKVVEVWVQFDLYNLFKQLKNG